MNRFRKIFSLILVLLLLISLSLSACQVQSPPQVLPDSPDGTTAGDVSDRGTDPTEISSVAPTTDETDPTDEPSQTEPPKEDAISETAEPSNSADQSEESTEQDPYTPGGEVDLLTIGSLETYEKFLRATDLPDSFISYSDLAALGSFDSFVCLTDAKAGDYSECLYSLVDDSGYRFSVYVYTEGATPNVTQTSIITSVNEADLRTLPSESRGDYTKNGLRYAYVVGKLLSISWTVDDVTIVISGNSLLYDYPNVSTTLVGKLLNTQTAESAAASISADLQK